MIKRIMISLIKKKMISPIIKLIKLIKLILKNLVVKIFEN